MRKRLSSSYSYSSLTLNATEVILHDIFSKITDQLTSGNLSTKLSAFDIPVFGIAKDFLADNDPKFSLMKSSCNLKENFKPVLEAWSKYINNWSDLYFGETHPSQNVSAELMKCCKFGTNFMEAHLEKFLDIMKYSIT